MAPTIQDKIRIKYNHDPLFRSYLGSVYLMMALDVCNTSSSLEISLAPTEFQKLSLNTFPGQNIDDFTTEAQRLVKVISMGYVLPYKTGSTLLSKVNATESNYFDQKVHTWQSTVKEMERSIGPNQDPKLLEIHPDYGKYSPLCLCVLLQTEYGLLLESEEWPAATATLPQGNAGSDTVSLNPNGRHCYKCGSHYHLANDPSCPGAGSTSDRNISGGGSTGDNGEVNFGGANAGGGNSGGTGTDTSGGSSNGNPPATDNDTSAPNPPGSSAWKYIKPADEDQKIIVNGFEFCFCGKCKYRHTGKVGFCNHTYTTSQHRSGQGNGGRNASNAGFSGTATDEANLSPVTETDTAKDDTPDKKSDSTSSSNPDKDSTEVDTDPDGLKFVGAFLSDIVEENEVWVAGVSDQEPLVDMTYGASLLCAPCSDTTDVNPTLKAKTTSSYLCSSSSISQEDDIQDTFVDCLSYEPDLLILDSDTLEFFDYVLHPPTLASDTPAAFNDSVSFHACVALQIFDLVSNLFNSVFAFEEEPSVLLIIYHLISYHTSQLLSGFGDCNQPLLGIQSL